MIVLKNEQSSERDSEIESLKSEEERDKVIVPKAEQKSEKFKSIFNKPKKTVLGNTEQNDPHPVSDEPRTEISPEPDVQESKPEPKPSATMGGPKKGKFANMFRKKENSKEDSNGEELLLTAEPEESSVIGESTADSESMANEELPSQEEVSKKKRKFSIFSKKKNRDREVESTTMADQNDDDQEKSGVDADEITDDHQKETVEEVVPKEAKKGKFKNIFKKKDGLKESDSTTELTKEVVDELCDEQSFNGIAQEQKDNTDPYLTMEPSTEDTTPKKSKFGIFSGKKKSEQSEKKSMGNEEIETHEDQFKEKPSIDDHTTKDKFKNIFSKKKKGEEQKHQLIPPEDEVEPEADAVPAVPSEVIEVRKEKFKDLFSHKKKSGKVNEDPDHSECETAENDPEKAAKKDKFRDLFSKKKKPEKEVTPSASDVECKLTESVQEISISSNLEETEAQKEDFKKESFMDKFHKKKEAQTLHVGQAVEANKEQPTELQLTKSKSFLRLSRRGKKKSKAPKEDDLQSELIPKETISASCDELFTSMVNENPAVLPLNRSMDKAAYKGSTYSLDEVLLRRDTYTDIVVKERPAVILLSNPNMIFPSPSERIGTLEVETENHPSASTGCLDDKESTLGSSGKFKNIFKKKKATEDPKKSHDSDDQKETSENDSYVAVAEIEKPKSKNIFKRKKKAPAEAESVAEKGELEEDEDADCLSLVVAPISISSMEKPAKHSKTWSERMKLSGKRMDTGSKDTLRNEDNEMDVPEDRMHLELEASSSAVKLFNETLEPSINSNITIEEQMQLLYDLFGHERDVIWDSYTPHQKEALKNKLKLVLDPGTNHTKRKNIEKHINDMTETIWNQSKYTDGVLNMGIIFVALLNEKELDVRMAKKFSLRPVFRTIRCYDKTTKSSKGCCMMFIDETGRVYSNWQHFMAENTYDPSIIVAPTHGVFNADDQGKVSLEFFTAPSSSVGAKLLSITDKTATVTGLGASACFIGGMLTVALLPVAAPAIGIAMAGAGLVGAASAGYSMVRSTQRMKDLSEHEKTLHIKDAEARGHWLGLIGGMTGFVSGVASHGVDLLARSGHHIPAFFRGSIDAINAASIAVNGVGVIDGFSTVFLKWNEEKISTLEIMQLSASLFMFTHSMYNFETASSIIQKHHDITVNEFRDKLGQTQRHHYHKMAQESLKVHGKGHRDVIRSLRAIPNQTDFQKMHKADNALTEGMVTAATLLVAKFCKKYFVVDENDLSNTILNAMTLLSDHAFDVFVDVVERFVECKGTLVQRSLRGIISVEEVMSDILNSVTSISESLGLDASEFIETLTKTDNFLQALIDRIYDIYKDYERVEPNQTCAECKGVFTVKRATA